MFDNTRFSSESRNVSMILRRPRSASERSEAVVASWPLANALTRDHIFIHATRDISQPPYPCVPIKSETLPIRIHRYPSSGQTPRTQLACGPSSWGPHAVCFGGALLFIASRHLLTRVVLFDVVFVAK